MSRGLRRPPRAFASRPCAPRLRAGEGSLLAGAPAPLPPGRSPAPRPPGAHAPAGQLRGGKFKNAARPAGRPASCLPRAAPHRTGRSRSRRSAGPGPVPGEEQGRRAGRQGGRRAAVGSPGSAAPEVPARGPLSPRYLPAAPSRAGQGRAGQGRRFRPRGLERGPAGSPPVPAEMLESYPAASPRQAMLESDPPFAMSGLVRNPGPARRPSPPDYR